MLRSRRENKRKELLEMGANEIKLAFEYIHTYAYVSSTYFIRERERETSVLNMGHHARSPERKTEIDRVECLAVIEDSRKDLPYPMIVIVASDK